MKIGLAGVGYLGSRHLKHLLAIPGWEVSGVWDTDPDVLARVNAEFGVRTAHGFDELLQWSDAIDLVTPTTTHCELGLQVIAAGKPLMVEKPVCATVEEANRLVQAANRAGVPVQVGHIERFNRAFRALQGRVIKPRFIEAHRLAPWTPRGVDVSVIYDLMIHDLDLILALSGREPTHIHASGVGVLTDSVDIATARLEFGGELVANVTASRISLKRMRKLRLFGAREYIALDLGKGTCEYVGGTLEGMALPDGAENLGLLSHKGMSLQLYRSMLKAPEADALRLELEEFKRVAARETEPTVSGQDGLKALAMAEKIARAIEQGGSAS